ncbi:MAG: alpha/beta hydrolase [Acidimicrobiia bacterium]|nr:alpha/beta hydrolase [Acidimicrobiia bacterium]
MAGVEARTVRYSVNGMSLVADHRGDPDAAPVLFLHGGGQTRHSWAGSARRLSDRGWHTVTLDARGHGESEWAPDGDYRLRSMAQDVLEVIDGFASPPLVVGASLGGLTAILLEGDLAPGASAGVVLVDIVPNWNNDGGERVREFMTDRMTEGFASLQEVATAVATYNPGRPPPTDLDGLKKNLRHRDGRWYWHWDPHFLTPAPGNPGGPPGEVADREALMTWTGRIGSPMMLVRGRTSDVVAEADARVFRQAFPHVEFVDVSGAGHMVAGDRNDVFTDAVVDFLERHHRRADQSALDGSGGAGGVQDESNGPV